MIFGICIRRIKRTWSLSRITFLALCTFQKFDTIYLSIYINLINKLLNVLSLYLSMYEIWIWYLLLINHILTRAKLFDAGLKLSPSYLLWKYNLIFPRIALLFTYLHKRYEFISSLSLPQGMYKPLCKYEDIYVQLKAY